MSFVLDPSNYHSKEANTRYLSVSQYKDFAGSLGFPGCEERALAKMNGLWQEELTDALLVGSYCDAHFEGTLDVFKAQHAQLFKKNGSLKSIYTKADEIINRIERDPYMMACLNGRKQVVMTFELFGFQWKIKIDAYHPGTAIVDLKIMKSITEGFWVKDYGKMSFIEFWGYDIQGAVYQQGVLKVTGEELPFLIAVASKEKTPDIEVIGFDQGRLSDVLREVETNIPRVIQVKRGEVRPERCGTCDYCKHTKVLKGPIHFSQILEKVRG